MVFSCNGLLIDYEILLCELRREKSVYVYRKIGMDWKVRDLKGKNK